jgi:hypothetical protein
LGMAGGDDGLPIVSLAKTKPPTKSRNADEPQ